MAELNKLVAKCVNASLGRWENLWATEQPSLVRLEGPEDVMRAMVYTYTNPVSSYLVKRSIHWPGLRSDPADLLEGTMEATRPDVFFRSEGSTPNALSLDICIPDCFSTMGEADVEIIVQRAREKYPDANPRIISDNGPQFIARDFKSFIMLAGMTHVRTAPYYPQSNGRIEAFHKTLKVTTIRPAAPSSFEEAQRVVTSFIDYYNNDGNNQVTFTLNQNRPRTPGAPRQMRRELVTRQSWFDGGTVALACLNGYRRSSSVHASRADSVRITWSSKVLAFSNSRSLRLEGVQGRGRNNIRSKEWLCEPNRWGSTQVSSRRQRRATQARRWRSFGKRSR